jgi:E1A/CREB-binding protein
MLRQIFQQAAERLLSLLHASNCQHVDGRCPRGYPNCKEMKELWLHVNVCRKRTCEYQRCVLSREVLSHYRECRDPQCIVCGGQQGMCPPPSSSPSRA